MIRIGLEERFASLIVRCATDSLNTWRWVIDLDCWELPQDCRIFYVYVCLSAGIVCVCVSVWREVGTWPPQHLARNSVIDTASWPASQSCDRHSIIVIDARRHIDIYHIHQQFRLKIENSLTRVHHSGIYDCSMIMDLATE